MPELITGHVRFTEKDFIFSNYNEKIKMVAENTAETLLLNLKNSNKKLINHITVDTLKESLLIICSLANQAGLTVEELLQ